MRLRWLLGALLDWVPLLCPKAQWLEPFVPRVPCVANRFG